MLEDVSIESGIEFWLFQCCHIIGWVRRRSRPCTVPSYRNNSFLHVRRVGCFFFSITLSSYELTDNPVNVSCEDTYIQERDSIQKLTCMLQPFSGHRLNSSNYF